MDRERIKRTARLAALPPTPQTGAPLRCGDLFCGAGILTEAALGLGLEVVYAYEDDGDARRAYAARYELEPQGDTDAIEDSFAAASMPLMDLIIGRFPTIAEFDGVIIRFLRMCHPLGMVLVGPGDASDYDTWEHIRRRTEHLGYTASIACLAGIDQDAGDGPEFTNQAIVATLRRGPFPWNDAGMAAMGEALGDGAEPSGDAAHPQVAAVLLEKLAEFVRIGPE